MKIAISSKEDSENSIVADRFARCDYFIIYDHTTLKFTSVPNTAKNEGSRAGGKAVRLLGDLGVDIALVPELGPEALESINTFKMKIYQYPREKTVREVLYMYYEKKLQNIENNN